MQRLRISFDDSGPVEFWEITVTRPSVPVESETDKHENAPAGSLARLNPRAFEADRSNLAVKQSHANRCVCDRVQSINRPQ